MDERKLRKYEYNLAISGVGVILFGAWTVIKVLMIIVITPMDELSASFSEEQKAYFGLEGYSDETMAYVAIFGILFALSVGLVVRFYIGRTAVRIGRRTRTKGFVYIVLAVMLSVNLILSTFNRYVGDKAPEDEWIDILDTASVSLIVDATSLLCLVELIISAIMVHRLRKGAV